MDTPAQPAADSVPATAPATAPAPAPSAAELRGAVGTMDLSDLDSLLGSPAASTPEPPPPAEPTPPAPVVTEPPAQPVEPVATPDPSKEGEQPPTDEPEPVPEKLGKFRVSARDFKEAEFLRLSKSMPVTEAYAKVYGATPEKPATPEPSTPAAPTPSPIDSEIATIKTEMEQLNAKLEEAHEVVDSREASRLTLEIARKERAIERLEGRKETEAAQAAQAKAQTVEDKFRQAETAAAAEAKKAYPWLGDRTSPERKEFDDFRKLKSEDPDYAPIFESPRWPLILARDFAEATGRKPAGSAPAAAPATPAAPAPAAPRATSATVIQPGSPSPGGSFVPSRESLLRDVQKMPLEELDKLLAAQA